jgi:hypothetical protein
MVENEAEVIQALESRIDGFYQALLQGDAQTAASFWTSDALILMPGVRLSGNEIPTFLAELLETAAFTAYNVDVLDWFIHGDVAYEISSYDETLQVEGQEVVVRNIDFCRWEREEGVWKVSRLVAGPRDAPPEG